MGADAPKFQTLKVESEGTLGLMTIARADRLNALSRQTLIDLASAARWFDTQRDVRVVIVSGEGRAFSAGFDLDDFSNPDPQFTTRDTADLGRVMAETVTNMRAVTVASIPSGMNDLLAVTSSSISPRAMLRELPSASVIVTLPPFSAASRPLTTSPLASTQVYD